MNNQKTLGSQLREARTAANLTVSEVAAKARLTPSHISQIERDVAKPSIGALNRVCEVLGIRMGVLFLHEETLVSDESSDELDVAVVRHDRRAKLTPPGSTIHHELLCPDLQHALEVFETYAPPGADLGDTSVTHPGEECSIVIKGTMEFIVGDRSFVLTAGDSIYFKASLPHYWRNIGQDELQIIWAAAPPHY